MNIYILLYVGVLFFVLTPNVFLTLPNALDTTSKYTVAGVHAVVFAIVIYLTYTVLETTKDKQIKEGFSGCVSNCVNRNRNRSSYTWFTSPSFGNGVNGKCKQDCGCNRSGYCPN